MDRAGAVAAQRPAEAYRRFGRSEAARASPLHGRVADAVSRSDEALRVLEAAPAGSRHPRLVLAALHDLALAGRAPALAEAYAAADPDAAARAAVGTLVQAGDAVVALTARRQVRTVDTQRCAATYPAVAEAARRAGADAVGLVDVGWWAGLTLAVDRVGITYGDGRRLGDAASPVQLSCAVRGGRPVPGRPVPEVVARVGVDPDPVDVTDADDVRWLRACVPPDAPDRRARLDAELALAAAAPAVLVPGAVDVLPAAVAHVPAGALPVVLTTWALSSVSHPARARFLDRLEEAAAVRPVAWVSVEGVGVAPSVPTLGDRPASGHSIVGVALVDRSAPRPEAVARCFGRGRWLQWLADA